MTPHISPLIEVKDLPSKFHFYPPNTKVYYRSFTYGEVKFLNGSQINAEKLLRVASNGVCVEIDGKQVEDPMGILTCGDFIYIGVLRKLSIYNTSAIEIRYNCDECLEDVNVEVVLDKIEFDEITAIHPPTIELNDSLTPFHSKTLAFRPMTIKKFLSRSNWDDISFMVAQANPENEAQETLIRSLIEGAVGMDIAKLEAIDASLDHGVAPYKTNCPKCDAPRYVELVTNGEGALPLVLPFRFKEVPAISVG